MMKTIEKNNLNELADIVIEEVLSNKKPFDTYTVIVPNILVEQWFKSYWIKKTNNVLMNVNFTRLNSFIDSVYNKDNKQLLSKDKMSLLIADILSKKDFDGITSYYKNNTTNLLDLSVNLAGLLLEYEMDCFDCNSYQKEILNELKNYKSFATISDIIKNEPLKMEKVFVFGFSKLEKIYVNAFDKIEDCTYLKQDSDLVCNREIKQLCSAASKEREIEYVHGQICLLLKEDNIKLSDILVYAPNIDEYTGAIKKVFSNVGYEKFPSIPYTILSNNREPSNTGDAIKLIYDILFSNEFTRNDFYKLISNPNVIKARNIDREKINDIIYALNSMCVYRNNERCDEWLYGIKRLLLSKLIGSNFNIENTIILDNQEYLPYGSISMDDESINILVSIVDDILEFKKKYNKGNISYQDFKNELDKWLSYTDDDNETNYYYKAALNTLDFIIDNNLNISLDMVVNEMISSSKNLSIYPSNILNGGITFINYNEKNILASKYMFFIGMGSNILPRKTIIDELDQRIDKELNSVVDERTFNMLRNNAKIDYFSYININLVSLEAYKPSTLLGAIEPTCTLNLMENRPYNELFSKSEFEKKKYNSDLTEGLGTRTLDSDTKLDSEIVYPEIVKYKNLSSLICENLMSKMKRFFNDYDDTLENISKSYEPITIDKINESQIKKEILNKLISNNESKIEQVTFDNILEKFKITHKIPYILKTDEICKSVDTYLEQLHDNSKIIEKFDVTLTTNINNELSIDWKLIVSDSFILSFDQDERTLYFKELKDKKYSRNSSLGDIYIISLAYVYKYLNDNVDYRIIFEKNYFVINSNQAKTILDNLYIEISNYDNLKIYPIDKIDVIDYEKVIKSIKQENGVWEYFKDKNLVDVRENAGYTRETFNDAWVDFEKYVLENVLYINLKKEK